MPRPSTGRTPPATPAAKVAAAVAAAMALIAAGGCGSEPPDPKVALSDAKKKLDAAETVHFTVTSAKLPNKGIVMVSGDGSAKRPSSFTGSFRMATSGISASIKVVSKDGVFCAQEPITKRYLKSTAAELGVADPADLLQPEHGISTLLTDAKSLEATGQVRAGRQVLDVITAKLPANVVGRFLYLADKSTTVDTTFNVVSDSHELRSASFVGPFYGKGTRSTYTITLDKYGEPVDIKQPC